MNFNHSAKAQEYLNKAQNFINQEIAPIEAGVHRERQESSDPWVSHPILDELKAKAKDQGLWNLFMPDSRYGAGLTNLEYAPIAEITGPSNLAQEVFNCNAPDTGNMEVLAKYGTDAQKEEWLLPLLAGDIRSCFAMTEPGVASSDATNMEATAKLDGSDVILNGRKWYISGFADPRTTLIIFMGLTDPKGRRHQQHSMVLVPKSTKGVRFIRHMEVFGRLDEPHGHAEIEFKNVRVPKENVLLGPSRGFEIAQGRLGPGRIHHCMRAIGVAEAALKMMVARGLSKTAFGKRLVELDGNRQKIAESRVEIDQARLLTMKAAWMMDEGGTKSARSEIAQIKVVAPNMAQRVLDRAIQMHGAAGVSDDFPLATMWAWNRVLRIVDGPDEVHLRTIARQEVKKFENQ